MIHWTALLLLAGTVIGGEAPPSPIPYAATAPAIDGGLDDACWRDAPVVRADYQEGPAGQLDPEPHLAVRYAWDERFLYIGYESWDRNLIAIGSGEEQGPPGNRREGCRFAVPGQKPDVVEFYVSFGDQRFMWELHHNPANQFSDIWCTVPDPAWPIAQSSLAEGPLLLMPEAWLRDDGADTVQRAVRPKPQADGTPSTVNLDGDVDSGWTGEIRLPWRSLGVPRNRFRQGGWRLADLDLRLLAVHQDSDFPYPSFYHHSSPTRRKGLYFHQCMPDWPLYRLATATSGEAGRTTSVPGIP